MDKYDNLVKMDIWDEDDEQEHVEVTQYGVHGKAVLAASLGPWAARFMPISPETMQKVLDCLNAGMEPEPLALMDGVADEDGEAESEEPHTAPARSPAAKKRRKGSTPTISLLKAILFSKTNIAKAEAQLGLLAACPKNRVNRSLAKSIDATIKELEYRKESLANRELQVEDAYIPERLETLCSVLTALSSALNEWLVFQRDGDTITTLAALEVTLSSVQSGPGQKEWGGGKHLPVFLIEEILRWRVICATKKSQYSAVSGIMCDDLVDVAFMSIDQSGQQAKRHDLQYRLMTQAMKTLALCDLDEKEFQQALKELCRPACPELEGRNSKRVLAVQVSSASAASDDFDMDLVPKSVQEKKKHEREAVPDVILDELRCIAALAFAHLFSFEKRAKAIEVYDNMNAPALPRAAFAGRAFRALADKTRNGFEAETSFREFCVAAVQRTRGFHTIHERAVAIVAEGLLADEEMPPSTRLQHVHAWMQDLFTGLSGEVIAATDGVMVELLGFDKNHFSEHRATLEVCHGRFIKFLRFILVVEGIAVQDVLKVAASSGPDILMDQKVATQSKANNSPYSGFSHNCGSRLSLVLFYLQSYSNPVFGGLSPL